MLLSLCFFVVNVDGNNGDGMDERENVKTELRSDVTDGEEILSKESQSLVASLMSARTTGARDIANRFFIAHGGEKVEVGSFDDFCGDGIMMRKYTPYEVNEGTILLFIHGGGWMQGNLDTHDCLCRKLADQLKIQVFAVDYRLAPEHPFPAPLDDVLSAYKWCVEQYSDSKIILAGDSAGGNLSAALCIKLDEDKGIKKPIAQILFYPALSNDFQSPSFSKFGNVAALSKDGTIAYTAQYAGKSLENPDNAKFIYPLLAPDYKVFPETVVVAAGSDVLIDGIGKFVENLKKANISVNYIEVPQAIHGFMTYGKEFKKEIDDVCSKLDSIITEIK